MKQSMLWHVQNRVCWRCGRRPAVPEQGDKELREPNSFAPYCSKCHAEHAAKWEGTATIDNRIQAHPRGVTQVEQT